MLIYAALCKFQSECVTYTFFLFLYMIVSVLFVYYISTDLSLAVPITNSLTFIWTGLSGKLLGEQFGNAGKLMQYGFFKRYMLLKVKELLTIFFVKK